MNVLNEWLKLFGVDLRRYIGPHPALVSGITAFLEAKIISKI